MTNVITLIRMGISISLLFIKKSRVYIEIQEKQDKVIIIIKNISKEKLNISSDELMQRFVRGDKARNTEGSGLGLSSSTNIFNYSTR